MLVKITKANRRKSSTYLLADTEDGSNKNAHHSLKILKCGYHIVRISEKLRNM